MKDPTIDTAQVCKLCGGAFTIRGILDHISYYTPAVDVVVAEGPCCHHTEELRIEEGKVVRGYVYAAGTSHFCGMEDYIVPGLELIEKTERLVFVLDGLKRVVPIEH